MEAMCMLLFYLMSLLGFDQTRLMVTTLQDFCQSETLFYFSLLNTLSALAVYLLVVLWQTLFEKNEPRCYHVPGRFWLYFRVLVRILLLLFAGLGMLTMPFTLFGDQSLIRYLIENKEQYVLLSICCAGLMIVVLSYLVQDLRYIMQLDTIDQMKRMQTISAEHLQSLRQFRHNMANMLYGMQGYIISGDREKLAAYYAEMCANCALVNNDNIASLEQIPSPAVRTLLLNHINTARQLDLPLNICVQDGLVIPRTLSEPDLCQVLGVLLDNAIEAANEAAERNVALEMRNVDGGLEAIVRNSYAGEVQTTLLTRGGGSTKEGHSGQGLASCYRILARKRGAHLNFWVTGQHVQAQLLLNR
jgi:sensor histidine kinase YesM